MAKNKIIYGNETLIDLTDDTVSANNLLSGATAHDRSGTQITGSVVIPTDFVPASTGGTFEGDVTIDKADGTTSTVGQSKLILGNSTGMGTDENSKGVVRLYSRGSKYVDICAPDGSAISDNYELNVPNKSGTIAVTSDIPAAQVNSDWDSSSGVSQILNKPTLATVATSGSYSDLSNKPSYLWASTGPSVGSLNDLVNLMNNSGNHRSYEGTIKVTADIGIGLTGWVRIFAISQNSPNNGSYDLGMFCMFFPSDTTNVKYALINGKTTGNYTVACIGQIPTGLQRVKKSCNSLPGANGIIFEEYTSGTNYNLPSNAWYHIISMQGEDTNYGTQLALGMTTTAIYYRNYINGSTWSAWQSLINTNIVTGVRGSAESSYKTGNVDISAANVGALPISGGTLTGQLNVIRSNSGTSSVDSVIVVGNSTASGTAGCTRGYIRLYGSNAYGANILPPNDNTAIRNYTLPTVTGNKTLAYYGENIGDFNNNMGYITSSGSCASATSAAYCKDANLIYCYLSNGTAILQGNSGKAVWLQIKDLNWKVAFQADGNLVIYQGNTAKWSSGTSSRRFKHNIQDMTEERARKILDIRPVTFDWNEDQPITTRQYDNAGVIAEEVADVCPDLVVFEGEDHSIARRVEYERFTPYLIKMVQTQQQEIDLLKQEVEILKQEVRLLKGE